MLGGFLYPSSQILYNSLIRWTVWTLETKTYDDLSTDKSRKGCHTFSDHLSAERPPAPPGPCAQIHFPAWGGSSHRSKEPPGWRWAADIHTIKSNKILSHHINNYINNHIFLGNTLLSSLPRNCLLHKTLVLVMCIFSTDCPCSPIKIFRTTHIKHWLSLSPIQKVLRTTPTKHRRSQVHIYYQDNCFRMLFKNDSLWEHSSLTYKQGNKNIPFTNKKKKLLNEVQTTFIFKNSPFRLKWASVPLVLRWNWITPT